MAVQEHGVHEEELYGPAELFTAQECARFRCLGTRSSVADYQTQPTSSTDAPAPHAVQRCQRLSTLQGAATDLLLSGLQLMYMPGDA